MGTSAFSPSPAGPPGVPGPLGVLATVRTAAGLYGADLGRLWQVMALVTVPLQALVFALRAITLPPGSVLAQGTIDVPAVGGNGFLITSFLGSVIGALIFLVSIGAAYRILLGRHLHHPADIFTSINFALDRTFGLLWVSILTGVVVLIGLFCFILPGIYLAITLAIAVPVLMAEDRRGLAALARSRELVRGRFWHVFGATVIAGAVLIAGELLFSSLAGSVVSAVDPRSVGADLAISGALNAVVSVLFTPFTAAVSVVLYVDMLLRDGDPQLQRLLA
ncbi:hypothetical protein [Conexibacter sp. DBS9H8]|uniref:hypothetical protein n=1 Tax=Conexibacter sp. DBS9H8 TaxID=2937801 RepID=UPI00200F7384|nr:hypothetical protein [Conexibacter sp. DBS9H8]